MENMKEIEQRTNNEQEFISECLMLDYEYEDIFEYLKTNYKG